MPYLATQGLALMAENGRWITAREVMCPLVGRDCMSFENPFASIVYWNRT